MFISYSDVVLPLMSQYYHFIFLSFIYLTFFDPGGSLCCTELFLVEVSRGYSFIPVHDFLIALASFVHSTGSRDTYFSSCGAWT